MRTILEDDEVMPVLTGSARDKDMIEHPQQWPLFGVLPLKHQTKRDEHGWRLLGFAFAHNPTLVYTGVIGMTAPDEAPSEQFDSVDALLDAGWMVD